MVEFADLGPPVAFRNAVADSQIVHLAFVVYGSIKGIASQSTEGTMQTACLRLMGKKLLVALTMEGKFAGEGCSRLMTMTCSRRWLENW